MLTKRQVRKGKGISLLVPFVTNDPRRQRTWNWLEEYWKHELPMADVCVGVNYDVPFSKTQAINMAASKAKGDIFVIMDADCFTRGEILVDCANRIRLERSRGHKLWFVPYRHFYRLTDNASKIVLDSDPADPFRYPVPPSMSDIENDPTSGIHQGHWFGALIQLMPREAFAQLGGTDPRFSGWGGEDVAFMRALDTLYARHMTVPTGVFHLWHVSRGSTWSERTWSVGELAGNNNKLFSKYYGAIGNVVRMRRIVEEGHREMVNKYERTESTKTVTIAHADVLDAFGVVLPPNGKTTMRMLEDVNGGFEVSTWDSADQKISTQVWGLADVMEILHILTPANGTVEISLGEDRNSLEITVSVVEVANYQSG